MTASGLPGLNIPRGQQRTLTYNGTPLYQSPEGCAYLYGLGIRWLGLSYPWSSVFDAVGTPSVSDADFTSMLAVSHLWQQLGGNVAIRGMDNADSKNDNPLTVPAVAGWLIAAGQAIAGSGLSPAQLYVSPWGECTDDESGDSNATWGPIVQAGVALLRGALPESAGWVLGAPGTYWNDPTHLMNDGGNRLLIQSAAGSAGEAPGTDWGVIYDVDYYSNATVAGNGAAALVADLQSSVVDAVLAWQEASAAAGAMPVVVVREIGNWNGNLPNTDPGNPAAWADSFLPIVQGCTPQGKKPLTCIFWDASNSDGNYNVAGLANGTELALSAANAEGLTAACAWAQAQN